MPIRTITLTDSRQFFVAPKYVLHSTCSGNVLTTPALSNMPARYVEDPIPKRSALNPSTILPVHSSLNPLPTPLKAHVLEFELKGYDRNHANYLVSGFRYGFKLRFTGTIEQHSAVKNHKSALENKHEVYTKLAKESLKNRIAGPFLNPPLQDLFCSPLGLVPKNIPGKFRLITDLSFPKGNSINSHIPPENSTVQYDSIDTVIKLIKQFGRHCLLSKCDVEDAFRLVPIHPLDYHLLGFTWNNMFYYDRCLPMGASSSCQIFESFSSSLQWIMENKYGASGVSHIIDDFLFVGPPNSDKCLLDLNCFSSVCSRLGVPLKP